MALVVVLVAATLGFCGAAEPGKPIKAGLIGLDTSHVISFMKVLNDPKAPESLRDLRIVAGYPGGNPDLEISWSRVKNFTEELRGMGVEIVDSIDALLKKVDVVILTSVDGGQHLEQARQVIEAGKPLFIDKPLANSLSDSVQILRLAREKNVPCFSSSSARFNAESQAVRKNDKDEYGKIRAVVAWSPAGGYPNQPEPFWFHGMHGVEMLFTVMGPGCRTVTRVAPDKIIAFWEDGRMGVFLANAPQYGATVVASKKSGSAGKSEGYEALLVAMVDFFKTGQPPVAAEETLEVMAFMEAADESQRQNGAPVTLESMMKKAGG